MARSALDVEQELLEVLHMEAQRLAERAEQGGLDKADRINLSYYLRAATDAGKAELERIKALDPKNLSDDLLGRLLAAAGMDVPKEPKRKRGDG